MGKPYSAPASLRTATGPSATANSRSRTWSSSDARGSQSVWLEWAKDYKRVDALAKQATNATVREIAEQDRAKLLSAGFASKESLLPPLQERELARMKELEADLTTTALLSSWSFGSHYAKVQYA